MIIDRLNFLTDHHIQNCPLYADYTMTMFPQKTISTLEDIPYLAVRAFKEFALKSVNDDEVYKTMRSSGTSGQFSQIFLDKHTAKLQTQTLIEIFADTFGKGRFPMLVIDCESTVRDRRRFSARTAAINGFSMFSRGREFALNDDMQLEFDRVEAFLKKHDGKSIFVFGFTYLIWQALIQPLLQSGRSLNLKNAFFLHGGGWKKLEAQKVTNKKFAEAITSATQCSNTRNYYGMVEQTGSIFMECEYGNLHAAQCSDVLIRDPVTHEPIGDEKVGLIQVFSTIQYSYPGHSILTEDLGMTVRGSSCNCGSEGTIVKVLGRLAKAEVRGCSDAYS